MPLTRCRGTAPSENTAPARQDGIEMSPRTASLQVAHQRDCPNESKTSLSSVGSGSGCKCKPRYYTFHRDERGRRIKGNRIGDRRVAEKELRKIQVEIDEGRTVASRSRCHADPAGVGRPLPRGDRRTARRRRDAEALHAGCVRGVAPHRCARARAHRAVRDGRPHDQGLRALARDVSPATKLRRLRDLRACLNEAGRKHIEHNPVSDYLRTAEGKGLTKAVPKRGKDAFTDVELEKLWAWR